MKDKKSCLRWGLTAFLTVCGILAFYDTFFLTGTLQKFFTKLMGILAPVLYGCAMTAFPSILLALVLISLLGPGKYHIILALGLVFIPSYARVVRSEFARQRELNYVSSARLMGAGNLRILFVHMLPNTGPVLLPAIVIGFNNAVLAEASMLVAYYG